MALPCLKLASSGSWQMSSGISGFPFLESPVAFLEGFAAGLVLVAQLSLGDRASGNFPAKDLVASGSQC